MSKMGEIAHLPSDKRVINRKQFRLVETYQGNTVPVIHGSLDSNMGKLNNKVFEALQELKGV